MRLGSIVISLFCSFCLLLGQLNAGPILSSEDAAKMREKTRAEYDKEYPYYIEVSSMTRVERLGFGIGGVGGHAVAYIKGIARDTTAPYPRVRVATAADYPDMTNPNAGVGVSVNQEFENVNWVATPGKDLFFYGNLKPDQRLNKEYMEKLADHMIELGTHKGIVLHPKFRKGNSPEEILRNVILRSMDTDFATNFGRYLHTVKIPIEPSMLPVIVDFLNNANEKFALRGEKYHWSGIENNCSHFVHNILAAIGYVKPKKVGNSTLALLDLPRRLFNMAIPADRMIRFAEEANETNPNDVARVYKRELSRKMLLEHDWLAVQPSVVVDLIAPHRQELNDAYKVHDPDSILIAETPRSVFEHIFMGKPKLKEQAIEMLRDPRYIDIQANRSYFSAQYELFKAQSTKFWEQWLWGEDFEEFKEEYKDHIDRKSADMEVKLMACARAMVALQAGK